MHLLSELEQLARPATDGPMVNDQMASDQRLRYLPGIQDASRSPMALFMLLQCKLRRHHT
jgi:hypothetical protein